MFTVGAVPLSAVGNTMARTRTNPTDQETIDDHP